MNILVYSHVPLWEIHHAEAVEIALKHISLKDKVFFLSCDGQLTSCPANAKHDVSLCDQCNKQTSYTVGNILEDKVIDLRLRLNHIDADISCDFDIYDVRGLTIEGIPFGDLVLSQIVDNNKDAYIDFKDFEKEIKMHLKNSYLLYNFGKNILKKYKIERLFVWNGRRCSDGPLVYAAKNSNVDWRIFISGHKKNTYVTCKTEKIQSLGFNKDYYTNFPVINDEIMASEANIFYGQMRYGGGDYPGFAFFGGNTSDVDIPLVDHKSKTIGIFPGSFWEYFAIEDYLHPSPEFRNHYDLLLRLLRDEWVIDNFHVIVRWHPHLKICGNNERSVINHIYDQTKNRIHHFLPEHEADSYQIMENSDYVISFGSTIGIEAAYYGKPSILVGRAIFEESGSVYMPDSYDKLIDLLSQDLQPLEKYGAVKYGYWARNRGNNQFEHLIQKENNIFFYKSRRLKCPDTQDNNPNRSKSKELLYAGYLAYQSRNHMKAIKLCMLSLQLDPTNHDAIIFANVLNSIKENNGK